MYNRSPHLPRPPNPHRRSGTSAHSIHTGPMTPPLHSLEGGQSPNTTDRDWPHPLQLLIVQLWTESRGSTLILYSLHSLQYTPTVTDQFTWLATLGSHTCLPVGGVMGLVSAGSWGDEEDGLRFLGSVTKKSKRSFLNNQLLFFALRKKWWFRLFTRRVMIQGSCGGRMGWRCTGYMGNILSL